MYVIIVDSGPWNVDRKLRSRQSGSSSSIYGTRRKWKYEYIRSAVVSIEPHTGSNAKYVLKIWTIFVTLKADALPTQTHFRGARQFQ